MDHEQVVLGAEALSEPVVKALPFVKLSLNPGHYHVLHRLADLSANGAQVLNHRGRLVWFRKGDKERRLRVVRRPFLSAISCLSSGVL